MGTLSAIYLAILYSYPMTPCCNVRARRFFATKQRSLRAFFAMLWTYAALSLLRNIAGGCAIRKAAVLRSAVPCRRLSLGSTDRSLAPVHRRALRSVARVCPAAGAWVLPYLASGRRLYAPLSAWESDTSTGQRGAAVLATFLSAVAVRDSKGGVFWQLRPFLRRDTTDARADTAAASVRRGA